MDDFTKYFVTITPALFLGTANIHEKPSSSKILKFKNMTYFNE